MPKIKIIDRVRVCIKPGHSTEQRKYETWFEFQLDKKDYGKRSVFFTWIPVHHKEKPQSRVRIQKNPFFSSVHFRKNHHTYAKDAAVSRKRGSKSQKKVSNSTRDLFVGNHGAPLSHNLYYCWKMPQHAEYTRKVCSVVRQIWIITAASRNARESLPGRARALLEAHYRAGKWTVNDEYYTQCCCHCKFGSLHIDPPASPLLSGPSLTTFMSELIFQSQRGVSAVKVQRTPLQSIKVHSVNGHSQHPKTTRDHQWLRTMCIVLYPIILNKKILILKNITRNRNISRNENLTIQKNQKE